MQEVFLAIAMSSGVQSLRRGYKLSYLLALSEQAARLCSEAEEPLLTALRFCEIYGGNIAQLNSEDAMLNAVKRAEESLKSDSEFFAGLSEFIDSASSPVKKELEKEADAFVPPEWSTQVPVTALKLSDAVKKLLIANGMQTAGDVLAFDANKKLESIDGVKANAIKLIRDAVASASPKEPEPASEGDVKTESDVAKTDDTTANVTSPS